MHIHGLQKLAMVDYPGKLAATVFTGGCNLRCPFCHNALLVTRLAASPEIPAADVLDFLAARRGLLDGVVLSGGEPLLQPDAADFLRRVREMGFSVKLDTNGCYPDALAAILEEGLADYVAMDVKNSPRRYGETVGVPDFDLAPVEESIRLLRNSGVAHEFRTTLVRELHREEDLDAIDDEILKLCLLVPEAETDRWFDGLRRRLPAGMTPTGGGNGCIDLIATGLHKAAGIRLLLDEYGVRPEECIAFGDSGNDLEMLAFVGESYAVANARPEVLAAAKHRAPANSEYGVLQVLEQLFPAR